MKSTIMDDYAAALVPDKPQAPFRPNGFYRFLDSNGDHCDMGFYCDRCKLLIEPNAPERILHCAKVALKPNWFERLLLPEFKVRTNV